MNGKNREQPNDSLPITCSVVIPTYNEAAIIEQSLSQVIDWKAMVPFEVEVIVADDGSTDDTVHISNTTLSSCDNAVVLQLPHRGKAATVLSGLEHSRGIVAGFMDADLATPLEMIEPAVDTALSTHGVVIGSREGAGSSRHNEPWIRHLMGRAFNQLVQLLLLPGIEDTQCGFKFFSRPALNAIQQHHQLYRTAPGIEQPRVTAFDIELLYIAKVNGFSIKPLPVQWSYGNRSKVRPLTDGLINAADVLRVRRNAWQRRYQVTETT